MEEAWLVEGVWMVLRGSGTLGGGCFGGEWETGETVVERAR